MGRKNSQNTKNELDELIYKYESAKAEEKQIYLDGDQFADIADWYAKELRFEDAQEVIDYGLRIHPGNTSLFIEQAYLYLDMQKVSQAKRVADCITETYDTQVKMLKAEILLNEDKPEEAQHLINTIENVHEIETIVDIIYLYLDTGYPEAAEEWINKGKALYSEEEEFIAVLAEYLAGIQHPEEAIQYFNKLIDKEPYNSFYWTELAKCYFSIDNIEKTIEACDFALAANDKHGEAYLYRAHGYFYLHNLDDAIENYKKAIEYKALPPALGYIFMSMSYFTEKAWQEASECCDEVIRLFEKDGEADSPLLIETYNTQAIAAVKMGRYEEAHRICEKAKSIHPKSALIFLTEGKVYLAEKMEKKAEAEFKKAIEFNSNVVIWYMVGVAYTELDYIDKAKKYYEKAYKINPNYKDLPERLSLISIITNDLEGFLKYNKACKFPLEEEGLRSLMDGAEYKKEDELIKKVLEQLRENTKLY